MVKSIRSRLQLWYALVLLVVIGGFAGLLYQQVRTYRLGQIDERLASAAQYLEATLRGLPPHELDGVPPPEGRRPPDGPGLRGPRPRPGGPLAPPPPRDLVRPDDFDGPGPPASERPSARSEWSAAAHARRSFAGRDRSARLAAGRARTTRRTIGPISSSGERPATCWPNPVTVMTSSVSSRPKSLRVSCRLLRWQPGRSPRGDSGRAAPHGDPGRQAGRSHAGRVRARLPGRCWRGPGGAGDWHGRRLGDHSRHHPAGRRHLATAAAISGANLSHRIDTARSTASWSVWPRC